MILDTKLFTPKNAILPGTLWVIEQIPGKVAGADKTDVLQFSYWSSYNVPYFTEIYEDSGYPAVDLKKNRTDGSEYQLAPRAMIFKRDHGSVSSVEGLQKILRYNGFNNGDEFAIDPWSAICSRGDLADPPSAGGCYDSKGTSASEFMKTGGAWVINGPTSQDQPTFVWEGDMASENGHEGMIETYDTEWEYVNQV